MADVNDKRFEEEIKRLSATFFQTESNRDGLISVTHVDIGKGRKTATVYISVMPEKKEKAAYDFLMRMRTDLRTYIKEHMRTRTIPFMSIEIDQGEKARQNIDRLSKEAGM